LQRTAESLRALLTESVKLGQMIDNMPMNVMVCFAKSQTVKDVFDDAQAEHEGLKKLCMDNNEDLFVYFEEYVEKSGPVSLAVTPKLPDPEGYSGKASWYCC
jgi:hypothetical protein